MRLPAELIFQFTPLREGRPVEPLTNSPALNFNSRPSARGDTLFKRYLISSTISIHAPPRGATIFPISSQAIPIISIHAPPRGATIVMFICPCSSCISIHAPPRGATLFAQAVYLHQFISIHAPPRGATNAGDDRALRTEISIHAPPRGATLQPPCNKDYKHISIHAPPRGATAKDMQFLQIFCSTLTNQHGLTIMPRNLSRLFW